jgi:hypothetical protein
MVAVLHPGSPWLEPLQIIDNRRNPNSQSAKVPSAGRQRHEKIEHVTGLLDCFDDDVDF